MYTIWRARKILEFQLALQRGSFQSFLALGKTWVNVFIIYLADALPGLFALCKWEWKVTCHAVKSSCLGQLDGTFNEAWTCVVAKRNHSFRLERVSNSWPLHTCPVLFSAVQCSPTVQISDFIIYIVSLLCRYWRKVIIIVIISLWTQYR